MDTINFQDFTKMGEWALLIAIVVGTIRDIVKGRQERALVDKSLNILGDTVKTLLTEISREIGTLTQKIGAFIERKKA